MFYFHNTPYNHHPFFAAPSGHCNSHRGRGPPHGHRWGPLSPNMRGGCAVQPSFLSPAAMILKTVLSIAFASVLFSILFRFVALSLMLLFSPPVLMLLLGVLTARAIAGPHHSISHPPVFLWHGRGRGPCRSRRAQHRCFEGVRGTALQEPELEEVSSNSQVSVDEKENGPNSEGGDKNGRTIHQDAFLRRNESTSSVGYVFDVPGFSSDDISVSVMHENELRVSGNRTNRIGDKFTFEHRYKFDTKVYDLSKVDCEMTEGVLEVTVAKKPLPQPRTIKVVTTSAGEKM